MTVNELIEALKETGDEKWRDMAKVVIEGSIALVDDCCNEISNEIESDVEQSDIKVGVNSVILKF